LDDHIIIRRCQDGRTEYLDVLVERYKIPLYTMCRKLTRFETGADDLFQDTWVRVLAKLDAFDPDRPFLTWLITICVNLYRDRYRKRRRWQKRVIGSSDDVRLAKRIASIGSANPGPDQQVIRAEMQAAVRRELDQLDDDHRLPLLLYYYRQMPVAEIADVLGLPSGTVKSRLANGRRKLGKQMEGVRRERA
jgi:RNA polymerase sigma-70 factor (ECF subfamily)